MRDLSTALLLVLLCATPTNGQESPPADQSSSASIPWPVKIGLRSLQVQQALPIIDRVVLVPDGATYLDELNRWSLSGRWPARSPVSRSACRTHLRSVSGLQPILAAIEHVAAHCEPWLSS